MYKKISDYGLIGNLSTCALVGKDGSIDFMCYPEFDSPFLFAGILDHKKGGSYCIQPKEKFVGWQQYLKNTNVLQTFFKTKKGIMTITDFMPLDQNPVLARKVTQNNHTAWFILKEKKDPPISASDLQKKLDMTVNFWQTWTKKCKFKNKNIIRSALALKLLINDKTGAICAAPTTSLPEELGGERNWDYRFNWIRDASMTARTLHKIGYIKEAKKYASWLIKTCGKNPEKIQIMYGLNGEKKLTEKILPNLEGYKKSSPVRIGNGAAKQKQLDIYGEIVNLLYETSAYGKTLNKREWTFIKGITDYVCKVWTQKDAGIWEVRGGYQHFVHSKLMCWVTLDRAIKIAKKRSTDKRIEHWEKARSAIKKNILSHGYNKTAKSFTQTFDSSSLDATSLLIPLFGLLPYKDQRVKNTINAVLKYLSTPGGLVHRYHVKETADGIKGNEGAFLLCSFWLIEALAKSGNQKKAKFIFRKILKMTSPTGLLSEEIDTKTHELLGNYPQAYSHIGLINCALLFSPYNKTAN